MTGFTKTIILCVLYILSGLAGGLLLGLAAMIVVRDLGHIPEPFHPFVFWFLLLGGAYKGISRAAKTWRLRPPPDLRPDHEGKGQ